MRILIIALVLAQPLAALPIVNGSFELPTLTTTQNISGAFTLTGWTGLAPSNGGNAGLVIGPDNGLTPAHGTQHFNLNGGNPSDRGWLEQTITTTPGALYDITFALGRAGGGQELSLTIFLNPEPVEGFGQTFLPPPATGYRFYTLAFTAPSAATTLRFTDTSGPNSISDLYLDAISVSQSTPAAVPEGTSTRSALLISLGALLLASRYLR
jgi:hypothetical protein